MPSPATPRPSCCFSASACSCGTPIRSATASVTSWPPISRIRTKRGTPPWCTTMLVTRAPTSTSASTWAPRPRWSASASERITANEVRSTITGERPAFWTASRLAFTMSRDAATSRPRSMAAPPSAVELLQRVEVEDGLVHRHRARSPAPGRRATSCSSSAGIQGRSTWRTMTFWFATPMTTFLLLNLVCAQSCLMASATASESTTSPSRTAPSGRATCPNFSSVTPPLPNDSSAARTPDVPMSRPMADRTATTIPLPEAAGAAWSGPWWGRFKRGDRTVRRPGLERSVQPTSDVEVKVCQSAAPQDRHECAQQHARAERDACDLRPARRTAIRATPTTPPSRKPRKPPDDQLGPAEPAQVDAEDAGELDVAEAHPGRVDEHQHEVEGVERRRRRGQPGAGAPAPRPRPPRPPAGPPRPGRTAARSRWAAA